MKKQIKAVGEIILGLAFLFAAAEARAEISIGMGVEGYVPAASRAADLRAAQLERLSSAADGLAATADSAKTEVLLAGLYSGSVIAEAAPAVYQEARVSSKVKLPKSAPLVSAVAALDRLMPAVKTPGVKSAEVEVSTSTVKPEKEEKKEDPKPTFGSMLLATIISIAIVAFFMLVLL
ncbi:MAG: hypothetical protein A2X35_10035 [Elusimicrobia bacterium GWA2_61_42]|nr:MAG: hypothetical protein A2X35_10035 [Elusimicrobia bacterium GWA2_61_42]OGR76651.1 MAG: hypothetical protein A2X38_03685 [Elusimicrobia bacterium GWC2_61_25]